MGKESVRHFQKVQFLIKKTLYPRSPIKDFTLRCNTCNTVSAYIAGSVTVSSECAQPDIELN